MSSAESLPPPLQTESPEHKASSVTSPTPVSPTPLNLHQRSVPKTSISHPINISWIIPNEYRSLLSQCDLPDDIDLYDLTDPVLEQQYAPKLAMECQVAADRPLARPMGNLALSSCPGKKVRLTGPSRGRAAINRDLDLDFGRMKSLGITTLVCCLDDTELGFLGAPWPKYFEAATQHGMQVIRLPMIEGSCPNSIEEIDAVILMVNEKIRLGENVLTHCRGGVGRAGVFACCWLLKNLYCLSAERAIRYVRIRRSPKAIETMRQAEFIIHYSQYISQMLERRQHHHRQQQLYVHEESHLVLQQENAFVPIDETALRPLQLSNTDYTLSVPSLSDISSLERSIRETELPQLPHVYQPPSNKSI